MKFMILILIAFSISIHASEAHKSHDDDHEKEHSSKEHGDEHGDEKEHGSKEHGDEHGDEGHEEAELPSGVTYFNDEKAEFSLKPNVIKNFEIKTAPAVLFGGSYKVPSEAVVRSLMKTSLFIFEDNKFRSIAVEQVSKDGGYITVRSQTSLIKANIVVHGANFLQTLLLSLEEGPSEGHGH